MISIDDTKFSEASGERQRYPMSQTERLPRRHVSSIMSTMGRSFTAGCRLQANADTVILPFVTELCAMEKYDPIAAECSAKGY